MHSDDRPGEGERARAIGGEATRATAYDLAAKLWTILVGPGTALLVAHELTPALQGYYYTFASILALQTLVDLGLGVVITQFASHEWAHLRFENGAIVGDDAAAGRLGSLTRLVLRWYAVAGLVILCGLEIGGAAFFGNGPEHDASWRGPWSVLAVATALSVSCQSIWAILDGCGQIASANRARALQNVALSISVWIVLLAGGELWAPAVSATAGLVVAGAVLWSRHGAFLRAAYRTFVAGHEIAWSRQVLPMQWRVAVSWASGYVAFSMFTPILFRFHGPVSAGRFGLTWVGVSAVGMLSMTWLSPRVPEMGMLIARQDFAALDQLFGKICRRVWLTAAVLALAGWAVIVLLYEMDLPLAARVLPPRETALWLLGHVVHIIGGPFSAYIRAHKREPLWPVGLLFAAIVLASNLTLGREFGPLGMSAGYLAANLCALPPVVAIWLVARHRWHAHP